MIAEVPDAFRAACHWRLYVGVLCGPDGLPDTSIPAGLRGNDRLAAVKNAIAVDRLREHIYPE